MKLADRDLRPLADVEKEHILRVLRFTLSIARAAAVLQIAPRTLQIKIHGWGLADEFMRRRRRGGAA